MISNEKNGGILDALQVGGSRQGTPEAAFLLGARIPYNAFEKHIKLRRHFSTVHNMQVTDVPTEKESHEDSPSEVRPDPWRAKANLNQKGN